MTEDPAAERSRAHRTFGLVVVGVALVIWWPAFCLGAYMEIFFPDLLGVWIASVAAIVVVAMRPSGRRDRVRRILLLLIPTLWLAVSVVDRWTTSDLGVLAAAVGGAAAFFGLPFSLWVLAQVLWPDFFEVVSRRARIGAISLIGGIALVSMTLGAVNFLFLTCEDFTASGNARPLVCVDELGEFHTDFADIGFDVDGG